MGLISRVSSRTYRDNMKNTTCFLLFVALIATCCVAEVCDESNKEAKDFCDTYKSAYDLSMSTCDGNNDCEEAAESICESNVKAVETRYKCDCPDDTCSGAFSSYQSLSMIIFLFIGKIFIE